MVHREAPMKRTITFSVVVLLVLSAAVTNPNLCMKEQNSCNWFWTWCGTCRG